MVLTAGDLPRYSDLIYPTLDAVQALGGSAQAREITSRVIEDLEISDDQLATRYAR
jgi:restriction system protein